METIYTVFFNDLNGVLSSIDFDKPHKALEFMKSKKNNECYLQVFKNMD